MKVVLRCSVCNTRLRVVDPEPDQRIKCPECGEQVRVPEADHDEPPPRRRREPDENECPACGVWVEYNAVLCVECGFNRETGKQLTTKVKRLNIDLDPTWSVRVRVILLVVLTVVLSGVLAGLLIRGLPAVPVLGGYAFLVLLSVFYLGTFYRLNLRRHKKGSLILAKHWRIAFFSVGTYEVDLKKYAAVIVECETSAGILSALIQLGAGPDVPAGNTGVGETYIFNVYLRAHHTLERFRLYRGTSETTSNTIVETLVDVAGLDRA